MALMTIMLTIPICAQIIPSRNISVNDGLPSSEVFHIIQDKKGFVWIASDKGVSKFNGYEFTHFDLNNGLPSVTTFELFQDKKERIWCITATGELSIIENDKMHPYKYNHSILTNKNENTYPIKRSFYADTLDNVYIAFENSTVLHITPKGEVKKYDDIESNQHIYNIDGHTIYSSKIQSPPKYLNIDLHKNDTVISIDTKAPTRSNGNRSISIPYNDYYLYTLNNMLIIIDESGNSKIIKHDKYIIWASIDNQGLLWLGFINGGAKAYEENNLYEPKYELANEKSVSSVLIDTDGACWISTLANGVYYFPILDMEIYDTKSGLSTNNITQIENIDNDIWFAGHSNKYYKYQNRNITEYEINHPGIYECRCIKGVGKDSLFLSYFGVTNCLSLIKYQNSTILSNIKSFFETAFKTKENKIFGGLEHLYLIENERFRHKITNTDFSKISDSQILNDSTVLLGTNYGLYVFHTQAERIEKYNNSELLSTRINCLHIDDDKNIWLGTKGKGLLLIHNEEISQIPIDYNIIGNSISGIKRKGNTLWIASNNGISKAELSKINDSILLQHPTKIPNLFNKEINSLAIDSTSVYLATQDGFVRFNDNYKVSTPICYFTSIKINGTHYKIKRNYVLESDQNNIDISFIGLNYANPHQSRYIYKLDGADSEWQTTTNRSVQYPALHPGKYTFKLKSINSQGVETENTLQIHFTIKKPYYETLWFQLIMGLLLIAIIAFISFTIFRIKLREAKTRIALTNSMNRYKQQALSAQMNPHFIHNSLNSIQSYILKNERELSSKYLSLFSKLMRQVLENSSSQLISLKDELSALELYIQLELIRFRNDFDFQITIDKEINLREIFLPPLLLQPYVENAIHHGLINKDGDKHLKINIDQKENKIVIEITDNGIGREKARELKMRRNNTYKSVSMDITGKRISLFESIYQNKIQLRIVDNTDNKGNALGTTVQIIKEI